jgi:hypothetical protein
MQLSLYSSFHSLFSFSFSCYVYILEYSFRYIVSSYVHTATAATAAVCVALYFVSRACVCVCVLRENRVSGEYEYIFFLIFYLEKNKNNTEDIYYMKRGVGNKMAATCTSSSSSFSHI